MQTFQKIDPLVMTSVLSNLHISTSKKDSFHENGKSIQVLSEKSTPNAYSQKARMLKKELLLSIFTQLCYIIKL